MLEAAERVRLIDEIRLLEELKSAISAAQAKAAAAFDASTRRAQAQAGLKADQLGRGVAAQLALARRESAHNGGKLLGLARILTTEMPHTLHALTTGVISEYRATILVRETACLSLADRQKVDELIAGNPAELEQLGDRKLIAKIKSLSYGLDPHAVVNRAAHAVSERYVSCRPAPDTMTWVTALLPVAQGVGVFAALTREADRLRAGGDPRTKGQIMADTFVERATGQARAEDARVEVQLIMTDQTLLHGILAPAKDHTGPQAGPDAGPHTGPQAGPGAGGAAGSVQAEAFVPDGAEPAVLAGYGIVPAQWARDLIRGPNPAPNDPNNKPNDPDNKPNDPDAPDDPGDDPGGGINTGWGTAARRPDAHTEVWLRRLYVAPLSGQLTAMDSRARLVPAGLARLIAARDQVCRTPWCGAPIRHYDHITPVREGGPTSAENIQGLCQACNQAKEAPGWTARVASVPAAPLTDSAVSADGLPAADGMGRPLEPSAQTRHRPEDRPPQRHTVITETPTGHVYRSTAPMLPAP